MKDRTGMQEIDTTTNAKSNRHLDNKKRKSFN